MDPEAVYRVKSETEKKNAYMQNLETGTDFEFGLNYFLYNAETPVFQLCLFFGNSDKSERTSENIYVIFSFTQHKGFPGSSDGKESASSGGDLGLIPGFGLRRSPGKGHGHPLHCSCLENPMDTGTQSMSLKEKNSR